MDVMSLRLLYTVKKARHPSSLDVWRIYYNSTHQSFDFSFLPEIFYQNHTRQIYLYI